MLTVPQYNVSYIAYTQTVYQNCSGTYLFRYSRRLFPVQFQHIPGRKDKDILLGYAQFSGNSRLGFQMPVFPVNRDGVFGFYQRVDQLDLFLAGMSGHMGILENDVGALAAQLVDDLRDCLFISRNGIGAENNGIVRLDGDFFVDICCHTGQGCHGFSLASCGDQHHLVIRVIPDLVDLYQRLIRNLQIAKLCCRTDDIDHTPAFHCHFSAVFVGRVDDLLYTVHIGGKGSNDDPGVSVF